MAALGQSARVERALLRLIARARRHVERAGDRLDLGKTRSARSRLKAADRGLRSFAYRLRSLAGRRGIADADRETLLDDSEPLRADILALRGLL